LSRSADELLWPIAEQDLSADEARAKRGARLKAMYDGANPVQRAPVDDYLAGTKYISIRCPRRSGKSYVLGLLCAYVGEHRPGSRILVISLTLKSTRENYWAGSPSGLFAMNDRFDLGLKWNETTCVWWHQNGSRGRLAGAETRADIEYLRGAAAEADLVVLDECKSFAPSLLEELIRDVLEPGLMTRNGVLVMAGTPGHIPVGRFFEATSESAKTGQGDPTCIPYARRLDEVYVEFRRRLQRETAEGEEVHEPWSLHTWTVQDNVARPGQWARALRTKRQAGWADDNPTWRREYLGEWVSDASGLVYAFAGVRAADQQKVLWWPERTRNNPTGLPVEDGPWHLVMGLDFGYEDDFAIVLAGYSERLAELRVVYDFKSPHLLMDDMVREIRGAQDKYGVPSFIVGDAGALGKLLVEEFTLKYGIAVEKAEKVEKYDHIELLNSDFHAGRVRVIAGSDLENELCGLQWDLSQKGKDELVRLGKLREDRSCPNHLCDALLYLWRFSYHHFARRDGGTPAPRMGTTEWYEAQEAEAERRSHSRVERRFTTDGHPGLDNERPFGRKEMAWTTAMNSIRSN
jgi:hypothetical protein